MPRGKKAPSPVLPEDINDSASSIAPSVIQAVSLGRLMRAPENVRQTNKAVDVESLADDIAAHGLLQSLIGYAGDTDIDAAAVYIVGGGRRLQALQLLRERGAIDDSFAVPVLLRDPDDAINLSLSENLAKRDMNAADEFTAFAQLMKRGSVSPADLARQFGFSERYVKQRLRLASLAGEILDALREGKLTIDAAMAYAESQDHKLQLRVFAVEAKKSHEPHKAWNIRFAYQSQQMTTSDPLFKLVGARRYEEQGGQYEDDLFGAAERYGNRKITDSAIVLSIARAVADFQKKRLLAVTQKTFPTTSDVLFSPAIRRGPMPKAPKGFKLVDKGYRYNLPSYEQLRDAAAEQGIDIVAVASVDNAGELSIEDRFFVPADRLKDVIPPEGSGPPSKTAEEIAAERRAKDVRSVAAWLAARKIRDEKIEGRQFWETNRPGLRRTRAVDGVGECYAVGVEVFVTPDEVDAQLEAAGIEYDQQEAEKAARLEAEAQAKAAAEATFAEKCAELLALDPPPAVIALGDMTFFRWESGVWCDERESPEADPVYGFDDLEEALEWAEAEGRSIDGHWVTIADHDRPLDAPINSDEAEEELA